MLFYSFECRKKRDVQNPNIVKTNKGEVMLLSKLPVCITKKSRFIKEQEVVAFSMIWLLEIFRFL